MKPSNLLFFLYLIFLSVLHTSIATDITRKYREEKTKNITQESSLWFSLSWVVLCLSWVWSHADDHFSIYPAIFTCLYCFCSRTSETLHVNEQRPKVAWWAENSIFSQFKRNWREVVTVNLNTGENRGWTQQDTQLVHIFMSEIWLKTGWAPLVQWVSHEKRTQHRLCQHSLHAFCIAVEFMKLALFTWGNFPSAAEHSSLYRRKAIRKTNAKQSYFMLAIEYTHFTSDIMQYAWWQPKVDFFFKGKEIPEEEDTHDLHSPSELGSLENHQNQFGTAHQSIGGRSAAAGSCWVGILPKHIHKGKMSSLIEQVGICKSVLMLKTS